MKAKMWWVMTCVLILAFAGSATAQLDQEGEAFVTIYERYLELWNTGEYDMLREVLTPGFVRHSQWEGDNVGYEEIAAVIQGFREAFGAETLHAVSEAVIEGE